MRIIGGSHKGRRFSFPASLPVRPTTDFAKESLFNILNNTIDFDGIHVLDLFSGSGNLSYELSSRNAHSILSIEQNPKCCAFIRKTTKEYEFPISVRQIDAFRFLNQKAMKSFDLILADPPYALKEIERLPQLILENGWLKPDGIFVLEHGSEHTFKSHPNMHDERIYGHVHFSFFGNESK